jgi:protein-disulfide isomerase
MALKVAVTVARTGDADAAIKLEAFVDLQCPDSKAVWPILLQLAKHYGPHKLQLVATLFPLPYHHNAFFAAQARPPFP